MQLGKDLHLEIRVHYVSLSSCHRIFWLFHGCDIDRLFTNLPSLFLQRAHRWILDLINTVLMSLDILIRNLL